MRVFYPMSARIADLTNEPSNLPAGITMLWSVFCLALLALVCTELPAFENSANPLNNQYNQSVSKNIPCTTSRAASDYVAAHRCAV